MYLKLVENFGKNPDGRVRMGPFTCTSDILRSKIEKHRLRLSLDDTPIFCSKTALGLYLSASGPDVQGNLIAEDGLEVAETDLEDFLDDVLVNQQTVALEGHVTYEPGVMVETKLTAWKMRDEVQSSYRKTLFKSGSNPKILSASQPRPILSEIPVLNLTSPTS